jgi:hypothetical protein
LKQTAAALFQMTGELFFLLLQGHAPLFQAHLLLVQRRLLGGDGGDLDAHRVALGFRSLFDGWIRQVQPEAEGADADHVAVLHTRQSGRLVVEEDVAIAGEVAEEEASLSVHDRGVQGLNAIDVQSYLAARRPAQQRHWPDQRTADAAEPAIDDDQFRRRQDRRVRRRRVDGSFHAKRPPGIRYRGIGLYRPKGRRKLTNNAECGMNKSFSRDPKGSALTERSPSGRG